MIIQKYGITIRRLAESDIELVRQMRNLPDIRQTMVYREYITPEMQKEWFHSINNPQNAYYIIEYKNKKIGLIHGKNNDFIKRVSEGGIFIWDKDYIGTLIPSLASVILNDYTFILQNFNGSYAKIRTENKTAISYNKMMGYTICEPLTDEPGVVWMILTKDNYLKKMKTLRKVIKNATGDGEPLSIENFSPSDEDSEESAERLYKGLPDYLQKLADEVMARNRKKE
jgi:UDP-4-amino-4,6-dideoxy-N-acetyl-beta-L-altrosamine N-acetyltransferase